jgi:hypothetical protein
LHLLNIESTLIEDRLFSIITGFTALLAFIVLAVWRIATKKLSIKEVVVLIVIIFATDVGSRL